MRGAGHLSAVDRAADGHDPDVDVTLLVLAGLLAVAATWEVVERVRERRRPAPVHMPADEARSEVLTVPCA